MSLINRNGAAGRETERAEGESSEAAGAGAPPKGVPDPELTERPKRRSFQRRVQGEGAQAGRRLQGTA